MVATVLVSVAVAAAGSAHPCRAPLPHGPAVPAPIILWTSCGSFRLAPDGQVTRLPRHWLALHSGGTGRRYGAHLNLRRDRAGRLVLLLRGRVVWRSHGLHPNDGGDVAFGPHEFAFASYRRGVFLTDLKGAERLVVRGRGLAPYYFTSNGDLLVTGSRSIRLVSRKSLVLRRFNYRARNGYTFDEQSNTLYYVTLDGRLATVHETGRARLGRRLRGVDGTVSLAQPGLLVFTGGQEFTVTHRDGTPVAHTSWNPRLVFDSGVSASPNGHAFAFRLLNVGANSQGTASVYVLRVGSTRPRLIYRHQLDRTYGVGAGFGWHGDNLFYQSSDGRLVILDTRSGRSTDLGPLARALPHWPGEHAYAAWRSEIHR
jgi:hypothetical protein